MYMFKGCPRCHGDLYRDQDVYGDFVLCLQCGYYLTDKEMQLANEVLAMRVARELAVEQGTALAA